MLKNYISIVVIPSMALMHTLQKQKSIAKHDVYNNSST